MAKVLPPKGKYYGTQIELLSGDTIEVWLSLKSAGYDASIREKANGWEPDDGFDHVETQESYEVASIIADTLTEKGY